jgi:hypothetical protein
VKSSCQFVFNHSVLFCPNLYSTNLHNSLTAPSRTALVPLRFSTTNRLLISLYYSMHKVFTSHIKSSQANSSSTTNFLWLSLTVNCLQVMLRTLLHSRGTTLVAGNRGSTVTSHGVPRDRYLGSPLVCWLLPSNKLQTFVVPLCYVTVNHRNTVTWSLHTVVWCHLRMRCIATIHARMKETPPQYCCVAHALERDHPGRRPVMPRANPSHYDIFKTNL